MSAHWVERDRNTVICVDWSQGILVRSLREHPEVEFFAQADGLVGSYSARAELISDPDLAGRWALKIWRRYREQSTPLYSPSRCDTLVRLTDCQCLQYALPGLLEQSFTVYPADSLDLMRLKIYDRINRFLTYHKLPTITGEEPVETTAFIENCYLNESAGELRVPRHQMVPLKQSDELLCQIFCDTPTPSWVNAHPVVVQGQVRLIALNWQAPDRRSPDMNCSQIITSIRTARELRIDPYREA